MFFEGPEKKLEIALPRGLPSLRGRGHAYWESVVAAARAKVISRLSNASCDAYLLSESSLFVCDNWLTMITCGQTDLVSAVLKLAADLGLDSIDSLIYERKNAHFQEYQPSNFFDDVRRLRAAMPGKAFQFGDGDDHHVFLFHLDKPYKPDAGDHTLEILMHGVAPASSHAFMQGPIPVLGQCEGPSLPGSRTGTEHTREYIREKTGVCSILPGFEVDDHLFDPMGYSLNAIRGDRYYTVHVTPQKLGSYVSFETNCFQCISDDPDRVVAAVLALFKPQSCDIVLFSPAGDPLELNCSYAVKNSVRQELACGYQVGFRHHYLPQAEPKPALELTP